MIDRDLAALYKVKTYRLNEQVRRNIKRFPLDFMFQLTDEEKNELIANCDRFASLKHSTSNPYAFTEQGIAMLSSVLNSDRAIEANIQIMRTFAKIRELMLVHKDLRHKIEGMPACRQAGKRNTTINSRSFSMPSRRFWNRRKNPKIQ